MNLSGWYRLPGTRGLKSAGGGLKLIWPGPRLLILRIHVQRECGNLPAGLPALGLLAGSLKQACCILYRCAIQFAMIKTFRHKGLKAFFEKGSTAGIQTAHAPRLAAILRRLNETTNAQGMNLPGWGLHPLKGRELKGHFSVWVNGNWRMTFTFDGLDAVLVDYQDYH